MLYQVALSRQPRTLSCPLVSNNHHDNTTFYKLYIVMYLLPVELLRNPLTFL